MPILESIMKGAPFRCIVPYVTKDGKAALVEAVNCRPESFYEECMATKHYYSKAGGIDYFHVVMSSPPGKCTPEESMTMAKEFVERNPMLHGFEVLLATHVDKPHVHTHLIIHSVCAVDGHKLHMNKREFRDVWLRLNREISQAHGFPVVEMKREKGDFRTDTKRKYEVVARRGREADCVIAYQAISRARKTACNWKEFEALLKENNVLIEYHPTRKHLVFGVGSHRFRDSNLAKSFTDETISKEMLDNEFCRNRREKDENRRLNEERRIDREIRNRERDVSHIIEESLSREHNCKNGNCRGERSRL